MTSSEPSHGFQWLQRIPDLPEDEDDNTQGIQEGRENGQGVSEEIQGEQQRVITFPFELLLPF